MTTPRPGLAVERELQRDGFDTVGGIDEVGRGALSGPVTVGVVVVDAATGRIPRGLRDSKLLTPEVRRRLVPRIRDWCVASAVADASATEIDRYGLITALRIATHRAVAALPMQPDCLLLDGNHDYVTPPLELALGSGGAPPDLLAAVPPVRTRVKADLRCAAVAAASVLAKTSRDTQMDVLSLRYPDFGWQENKGYATPDHRDALRRLGPTELHRRSWRLGLPPD